jgi:hypothetical protein
VWALPLTTLSALCASEHAEHRQRSHPRSDANHNLVIITTSIKHQTYSLHQTSLLLPRGAVALQPPLLEQMERVSTRHAPHPTEISGRVRRSLRSHTPSTRKRRQAGKRHRGYLEHRSSRRSKLNQQSNGEHARDTAHNPTCKSTQTDTTATCSKLISQLQKSKQLRADPASGPS